MNGEPPSSDRAIPWTTVLVAALAAAIGFVAAFALARAVTDGAGAGAPDRVAPLDAPAGQARVRNLERAGRIPQLRLSSRSDGTRPDATRASTTDPRGGSPSAARSAPRRSGGARPRRAPTEGEDTPGGGPEPPADVHDPSPDGGASTGP